MKYLLCVCVYAHTLWVCVWKLQRKCFSWIVVIGLVISKGLPTSRLSDSPRRWCSYRSLSSVELYPWDHHTLEHKSLSPPPLLPDDWAKKHLHSSPDLKQRNLWSLGGNLGKVPAVKAKRLSLCERLLWNDSPELAWRFVPRAGRGWSMQFMPEGHRDREGKGWKWGQLLRYQEKLPAQPLVAPHSVFVMEPRWSGGEE